MVAIGVMSDNECTMVHSPALPLFFSTHLRWNMWLRKLFQEWAVNKLCVLQHPSRLVLTRTFRISWRSTANNPVSKYPEDFRFSIPMRHGMWIWSASYRAYLQCPQRHTLILYMLYSTDNLGKNAFLYFIYFKVCNLDQFNITFGKLSESKVLWGRRKVVFYTSVICLKHFHSPTKNVSCLMQYFYNLL